MEGWWGLRGRCLQAGPSDRAVAIACHYFALERKGAAHELGFELEPRSRRAGAVASGLEAPSLAASGSSSLRSAAKPGRLRSPDTLAVHVSAPVDTIAV